MSVSHPRPDYGQSIYLLREQLNEMMAAAQGLEQMAAADPNSRRCLAVLYQGLYRQLRLIRRLELDQRLHSEDEVRLSIVPADLVQLGRRLADQLNHLTNQLEIRVSFTTPLAALSTLADPGALEDLFLCLISNALESIGCGGQVTLTLEQQGDKAIFTLSDSGAGLNEKAMAALFQPREGDDMDGTPSLGLGLPLARQIALLHGGSLMLDQQEGGARFLLSLPLREPDQQHLLHTPRIPMDDQGGWEKALVELSHCLPAQAFFPEDGQ